MEFLQSLFTLAFLATLIRSTAPLLLAALGGLYSERSGIVNIALEGIIIFGALAGAVITERVEGSVGALAPWIGWLGGAAVGGFVAWIHGVVSIKYRADQIISGTAVNLLALGVPPVLLGALYNNVTNSDPVENPLPLVGFGDFLSFSPPVYFAFLMVAVTWYVLYRTPYGLRIRATGEHPQASASMGVNVRRVRYSAVIVSGLLAGTAGVFLSIGNSDDFTRGVSAGQGFIALAALIFGQWRPLGVLGATLLFGFLRAVSIQLGGSDVLPSSLVEALPYVITILALAFTGRASAPRAVGKPFDG
jgi:simple sugar transport system permease protein